MVPKTITFDGYTYRGGAKCAAVLQVSDFGFTGSGTGDSLYYVEVLSATGGEVYSYQQGAGVTSSSTSSEKFTPGEFNRFTVFFYPDEKTYSTGNLNRGSFTFKVAGKKSGISTNSYTMRFTAGEESQCNIRPKLATPRYLRAEDWDLGADESNNFFAHWLAPRPPSGCGTVTPQVSVKATGSNNWSSPSAITEYEENSGKGPAVTPGTYTARVRLTSASCITSEWSAASPQFTVD